MKPGVYVHLPFCKVHCAYCDFPLTARRSLAAEYYDCLLREIAMRPAPPSDTLYFGGGTPSLTPPEMLRRIRDCFTLHPGSEVTLEANPDDVTVAILAEWRSLGITRLSLGIQSLEADALRDALRQHTPQQAMESLEAALRAGFESVNADLILGLPGQTPDGFLAGLRQILGMRLRHFSIYFLEIHSGTALQKQIDAGRRVPLPEEDLLECYTTAVELLENEGYVHYEVSNFALPGFESRHNLKYWSAAPYYAYGPGACSYYDSKRIRNIASVTGYLRAVQSGTAPALETEGEDAETRMRNALIFGLRRRGGVDRAEFEAAYGKDPLALFPEPDTLADAGLLEVGAGRIRLTLRGLLISTEILSELV